jgi:colicin import membrane protein
VPPAIVTEKLPKRPSPQPARPDDTPLPADRARLARQEAALRKLDEQARTLQKQAQAEDALRQLDRSLQDKAAAERAEAARQALGDSRVRALQGAIDRIQARIKENTVVPPSVPAGIRFRVAFTLLPDGSVLDGSIRVLQGSGSATYDEAVQRAILAAQPLPMPDDVALRRQMRDVSLTTTNLR